MMLQKLTPVPGRNAIQLRSWSAPLIAVLLLLSGSGCSTFNHDWKAAAAEPAPTGAIQGRWGGTWLSETRGHHGSLRCLLSKTTDYQYDARFHAKFWKIFSFGYTVPLVAVPADEAYQFKGDADLGRLAGGMYHYEGHATLTNFFSTYRSKADHGVFQMQRPGANDQ